MCPSLFGLNSYRLLVGLGLVYGLTLFALRSRNRGIPTLTTALLAGAGLLVAFFGARLPYWIFVPADFVSTAIAFLLPGGGTALNGGIILIIAAVAFVCRLHSISFLALADVVVPCGPLAIIFFSPGLLL